MKNRSETAQMPVLLGARRAEDPIRTVSYVEGPRPENAEQGGQMCGRSRFFMNDPG